MSVLEKNLAEKFDLAVPEPASVPAVIPPAPVVEEATPATISSEIDDDTAKARRTLTALIDTSVSSLNDLIRVAKDSENPRAYEVVAQMIKATADISKDLLTIQKIRREVKPADDDSKPSKTSIGTQQNIFVGSTNDLLRALAAAGMKGPGPAHMEIPANAEITSPA